MCSSTVEIRSATTAALAAVACGPRQAADRRADRLDRRRPRKALAVGERDAARRHRLARTEPARPAGCGTCGVSASRGSTETPSPDATMLRTVSSEFVRVTCASARFSSGHASSTWSRKQWPMLSRIVFSAGELVRADRLALRPLVRRGHDDLERLLVQEFGDDARRRERQRDDRSVDASGPERRLRGSRSGSPRCRAASAARGRAAPG